MISQIDFVSIYLLEMEPRSLNDGRGALVCLCWINSANSATFVSTSRHILSVYVYVHVPDITQSSALAPMPVGHGNRSWRMQGGRCRIPHAIRPSQLQDFLYLEDSSVDASRMPLPGASPVNITTSCAPGGSGPLLSSTAADISRY